ncbi:MAG: TPM domain-containing protein [Spirochaetia bacterium]|nr:TPM domain-containing protein [Spirochaetia bacterium]
MHIFFSLILILSFTASCSEKSDIPELKSPIMDTAEILSPQTEADLEDMLRLHEEETKIQVAVLTIPSLKDEVLEEYSMRVVEKWKLGQKDKDNGVLILIAKEDRKMRIEVGYGLEGDLTDVAASLIIRNDMAPRFKNGDYDGGVKAGVISVIRANKGEYFSNESEAHEKGEKGLSRLESVQKTIESDEIQSEKKSFLIRFFRIFIDDSPIWLKIFAAAALICGYILLFPFFTLMAKGLVMEDVEGWTLFVFVDLIPLGAYLFFGWLPECMDVCFLKFAIFLSIPFILRILALHTDIGGFILTMLYELINLLNWARNISSLFDSDSDYSSSSSYSSSDSDSFSGGGGDFGGGGASGSW